MNVLLFLVPITLFLGFLGLVCFLWNVKSKQYEDLEGAANRILFDETIPEQTSDQNKERDKK